MVNRKTVIKFILFIVIISSLLFFVFTNDSGTDVPINNGVVQQPAEEDAKAEEGATETPEQQPVETPEAFNDKALENRAEFIDSTKEEIDGHRFLTSNSKYELYLKEENLSIIMRDKNTGAVMYSTVDQPVKSNENWTNFMKSSVVMEYLVGTNIVTYRADMYTENPEKEVNYNDDGFTAKISYSKLGISYQLQVTLTDMGIVAEIPQDKIEETSDKYKVSGFYVYPFLGYSKLGEREGYMFIPDGSGALIKLENNDGKYPQPYSEMVYGKNVGIDDPFVLSLFNNRNPFNDPEKILAPVFGMVQTDSKMGYLGIIEEGQFSSKIEAYPNGAILPYNWITPKFIYRQFYNQPTSKDSGTMVVRQKNMNNFNIKVRYEFVSEDKADYVGLAEVYRNYLIDNEMIVKKENDFNVRVDLFGADVEKGLIFAKDVPMTSFEQASNIYKDLKGNGVDEVLSIYKGWQESGYYGGLPIKSFDPESSLSDEMDLLDLITESKEEEIDLYLYHDALRVNPDEAGQRNIKVMKKFNKRTYEDNIYGKVYRSLNYLNPASTVKLMESMKEEYQQKNIENILISGISNEMFSYSEDSKEIDRINTMQNYESTIKDYNDHFNLMLEQPFSYLWNHSKAIIDLPAGSSDYVFTDEDIPFLALVLKGIVPMYSEYINFQANQNEFFLQMIEQGLNPSFYITHEDPSELLNTNSSHIYSSKYERYEEMIQEYYTELKEVHEKTKDSIIEDYERVDGVTKVTYENGIIVYVNYKNDDVNIDGQTIESLSYKVVQGR